MRNPFQIRGQEVAILVRAPGMDPLIHPPMEVLIDLQDLERVANMPTSWLAVPASCGKDWVVRAKFDRRYISLHRWLLGLTDRRLQVRHLSGNGLDNRRANLLVASPHQIRALARKERQERRQALAPDLIGARS